MIGHDKIILLRSVTFQAPTEVGIRYVLPTANWWDHDNEKEFDWSSELLITRVHSAGVCVCVLNSN